MSGGSTGGAYRVIGIESSPYAVKVRAVMRYRRLPHAWVARSPRFFAETQHVRPLIMPVVQYPDGEYRTDSTPILLDLEDRHADRSILPDAPDQAFLALLIEDMADEWLTKSLFHYRFSHAPDRRFAGSWVMDDAHPDIDADELETVTAAFVARQTERMPLVGCTKENGPHFERFYEAVLEILERFVATDRFLFGSRPSIADFGLYGQLSTLSTDPTPGALIRAKAPRALHWIWRTADASGVEGAWRDPAAPGARPHPAAAPPRRRHIPPVPPRQRPGARRGRRRSRAYPERPDLPPAPLPLSGQMLQRAPRPLRRPAGRCPVAARPAPGRDGVSALAHGLGGRRALGTPAAPG